jgi:hypothetical protein
MVPLYFIRKRNIKSKIIVIGLAGLPLIEHYKFGMLLQKAINNTNKKVVYIASGDLSHKLQTYGPYGYIEEGPEYDKQIMEVCGKAKFLELLKFKPEFLDKAAECGHRSFTIMAGTFDKLNVDLSWFIKEMLVLESSFYVSCSSLERRMLKDINFDFYKNFFIRPVNKPYQFVGDFILTKDGESYYKVKDIYINDSKEIKKFEKEFKFEVKIKNDYKKSFSDTKVIRSIINDTLNVYDFRCLDFVRDFESYLEFEKKHFIKKLGFYKTLEFKAIELKEIKRSLNVCKKYEEDVYFDDGNNYIYVDRDCPTSEPYNNVIAVEFVVKIKKTEEAYNKLQFFISQEIEIANELDALDNNEL